MNTLLVVVALIAVAFLAIVGYEAFVSYRKNIRVYTLADSLVNVYCGMLERTFDLFYAVIFLFASNYLYENVAPFKIPANFLTWILGLLIFDFFAYWFHRLSHEINFLWAAHIVHHQSEELNFTTVFRVSFFAVIFRSAFFIWMPLMGFDPMTILTLGVFLAGYQFLTHSRLIGKLGFLEYFMTTPSHHRVHHGRNPKYMDHNYGHIFIFWDRMFGTFVPEDDEPQYGITSGFESNNPFYAQFAYWRDLLLRALRANRVTDKLLVFLKGPAWTPSDVGFLPYEYKTDHLGNRVKRDVKIGSELATYVLSNTAISIAAFVRLFWVVNSMKSPSLGDLLARTEVMAWVALILVSVYAHGRQLEKSGHAFAAELLRLSLLVFVVFHVFDGTEVGLWLVPAAFSTVALMFVWLVRLSFFRTPPAQASLGQ